MAVAQHVEVKADPRALGQPADELVHGVVAQWLAMGLGKQVHEYVVAVCLAVLVEHVGAVEPHEARRDWEACHVQRLGPRPVRVVVPGHDEYFAAVGDEVRVA